MTAKQYLEAALPEEYYHLVLMNAVQFIDHTDPKTGAITHKHETLLDREADSPEHALEMLFSFEAAREAEHNPKFWFIVRDHLLNPEVTLPPIP